MRSAPINPEVLIVARDSRGCTQDQVADAAGISQGLVSKAESGSVSLPPDTVSAIADFLGYPSSLFYEPGRVREVGSPCLYHRKRKTLPAKVLKGLDARMFMRHINVTRLLHGLDVEGDRTFHTLDVDEYGSPVEVARALRAIWRVPEGPIPNLTTLIESAGGIVLMEDFGTRKLFGMSCWTTRGPPPLFFLNSAIPTADLRWTMAHELGHLTMHGTPSEGDQEEQADAFAGEFLTPQGLFGPDVRRPRLDFQRLPLLKTHWRISMKAVIKRAESIGAISRQVAVRLYKQHSARGYNSAEPYPLKAESPTLVNRAIQVHLQDHGYSNDELAAAVRLLPEEFGRDFLGIHERVHGGNVVNLFENRVPSSA